MENKKMSVEPKELNSRHRSMMYALNLEGLSVKETADKFDISVSYLSAIKNSPLWKDEEKKIHEEIIKGHKSKLESLIPKAIDVLEQTMDAGYKVELLDGTHKMIFNPPATRSNAAGMILDRVGLAKGEQHDGQRPITIQLYAPPWADDSQKNGNIIEVVVEGDK